MFVFLKLFYLDPMVIKEVLQSLIDDNLIDQEKIGASNVYWAFPSKALIVVLLKYFREIILLKN